MTKREVLSPAGFYSWGNRGTGKLGNLPEVPEPRLGLSLQDLCWCPVCGEPAHRLSSGHTARRTHRSRYAVTETAAGPPAGDTTLGGHASRHPPPATCPQQQPRVSGAMQGGLTWITLPYFTTSPCTFLFSVSFCFCSIWAACCADTRRGGSWAQKPAPAGPRPLPPHTCTHTHVHAHTHTAPGTVPGLTPQRPYRPFPPSVDEELTEHGA